MVHIEGEIVIHRAVEDVFDCVADECNEPHYNPQMLQAEKISPGPVGVGTRFRAVSKTAGGTAATTIEITAFERSHRVSSSTHLSSMEIQGTLTLAPVPEGTRM